MKKLVFCVAVLGLGSPVLAAGSNSVSTVAGTLSGRCQPSGESGRYVYMLGRTRLRSLESECSPDGGSSYTTFPRRWSARGRTTVLNLEGNGTVWSQTVRLLHFQPKGKPLSLETSGADISIATQLSPTRYRLVLPGSGFAVSGEKMSHWKCDYLVDFGTRKVVAKLVASDKRVPKSVCETSITTAS